MQVQFEKIPPFLKSYAQFCNWKYEQRDGNQTKVPYIPGTTRRADVSNPVTFAAFDAAASATGFDGIGIRVSGRISSVPRQLRMDWVSRIPAAVQAPMA